MILGPNPPETQIDKEARLRLFVYFQHLQFNVQSVLYYFVFGLHLRKKFRNYKH